MVLLLLTVIIARFPRGDEKAFWFGFAVFGWGFFLLGFGLCRRMFNLTGLDVERSSGGYH